MVLRLFLMDMEAPPLMEPRPSQATRSSMCLYGFPRRPTTPPLCALTMDNPIVSETLPRPATQIMIVSFDRAMPLILIRPGHRLVLPRRGTPTPSRQTPSDLIGP